MRQAVALVGAGLMGTGLARLFRAAGWNVAAFDADRLALAALCDAVEGVRAGADLGDAVAGAAFVIEAVSERLEVKRAVFAALSACVDAEAIVATNSSVIAVGAITQEVDDGFAARTIGAHFWNPPDIVPLVEVIPGPRTGAGTVAATMAMLRDAGKEPIEVRRDTVPGNRLQHALWREAIALVEEGVCTPEDVDTIVKRSFGLRLAVLGPLENADLVGLTLTEQIHQVVFPTLSRASTPSPVLAERIARGDVGVASGAGFYRGWTADKVQELRTRLTAHLRQATRRTPADRPVGGPSG